MKAPSPNHWTAKELPKVDFYFLVFSRSLKKMEDNLNISFRELCKQYVCSIFIKVNKNVNITHGYIFCSGIKSTVNSDKPGC